MWSLIKVVLLSALASATLRCPDGSSCLEDSACCKLPAGGYGCCPVEEDGFSRLSKPQAPGMKSGAESSRVSSNSSIVKCDHLYHCPDYYLCCKTDSGHWTCCPHPSTVCCYRGTKCCPADNTPSSAALEDRTDPVEGESLPEVAIQSNDISTGPAIGDQDGFSRLSEAQVPEMKSGAESSRVSSNSSIVKCDHLYHCPDYYLCCKTDSGHWTCCPHPSTVCCYRGTKCCPADNTPSSAALEDRTDPVEGESLPEVAIQSNDISTGPAIGDQDGFSRLSEAQVPEMKSGAESSRVSSNSSIVKCDHLYHCPDYYLCCKTDSGHWTCCPHPSTVCCYRGTKCCPADNTPSSAALEDRTDPVEGESLPEVAIQSNDISTGPAIGDQDGFSRLSEAQVPEMKSGAESSRVSSNSSIVKCDHLYHCPDYYLCCKTDSGHWTCCPHPSTVCCYRGTKCCPADNTPSSAALEDRTDPVEGESLPEVAIQSNDISTGPAIGDQDGFSRLSEAQVPEMKSGAESSRVSSNSSIVKCDHLYHCPDYYLCCKTDSGHWTCCPHPSTVCCYRGTKCCPADNTPSSAALEDRTDPVEGESLPEVAIQSNDISTGPAIGDQAKCCKDGGNCCPPGTECDPQSSKCRKDDVSFPWGIKKPALRISEAQQNCEGSDCSVTRCDDTHVCKAGTSCCKMSNHQWGCCPYPDAHCCWDGKHCCPHHHWCDTKTNRCRRWWPPYEWKQISSTKYDKGSENL
ncbi:progranulin-like [Mobula birostris]|uniref:progranulin-like n=1 Tax=Mobula birostris TaxID=1983395 RepID=UPI003B282EB1